MRAETLEDGTALGIVGISSGRQWRRRTRFARPLFIDAKSFELPSGAGEQDRSFPQYNGEAPDIYHH